MKVRSQCLLWLVLSVIAAVRWTTSIACVLTPTRFRTNNLHHPLAIASHKPVFSWALGFEGGGFDPPEQEIGVDHHQTAFRLTCYEVHESISNQSLVLWDSGRVFSRETLQIEYAGQPLRSLQRIQWHVLVWDENGQECNSTTEDPWFETGLLDEESWGNSSWIARYGPMPWNTSLCSMMEDAEENQAPRFRAVFHDIPESVVQARAYISGLGYYSLHINGQRVGESMLDPGWTTYSKRVLYSAYDVTSLLNMNDDGQQVVGVELGNGWWNPLPILMFGSKNLRKTLIANQNLSSSRPMFRLRIIGFKSDGTVVSLLETGDSSQWAVSGSPTIFNNIYLGEKYDARLELAYDRWTTTRYVPATINTTQNGLSATWGKVTIAEVLGLGPLEAQEVPPIRIQKWLVSTPVSTTFESGNSESVAILDTGINHAGSCRIQVKQQGPDAVGKPIKLRYGELLYPDGSLNVLTSVAGHIAEKNPNAPCQPDVAYQSDTLILGALAVDWTPAWSWHGFRYIEVTTPTFVSLDDISIRCFTMRSGVDLVANFSSSDPWLSDLRQLVQNTYESNMMSLQSDCPHRERFGYGGDVLGSGEAGLSLYDFSAFYRKRVLDYNDAQVVSPLSALSGFTETAPDVGIDTAGLGPQMGPIGWETVQPEALLWLYKYYGDTRTLKESYNHTLAYIQLLENADSKLIEGGLGDWLAVDDTDVAFTGRGFQYMSYLAFANITEILGLSPDLTNRFRQKAAVLVDMINSRFLHDSGEYKVGTGKRTGEITQTGQGMALFHGYISANSSLRGEALRRLVENANQSNNMQGACQGHAKWKGPPGCKEARGGPGPHITGGLFGVKWILMALADGGQNDIAYDMVTNPTYPGLRWMMNNSFANATTIWETFYFSDAFKSHNHPMFSSTEVWLLQSVAGIQPHPSAKGMDHVLIKPSPPFPLMHATASFESPRGVTRVSWSRFPPSSGVDFELNVTIPPNCIATVHVPAQQGVTCRLDGARVSAATWVPDVLDENRGSWVVRIGSGRYQFQAGSVIVSDTSTMD